jgi:hypothetical protein
MGGSPSRCSPAKRASSRLSDLGLYRTAEKLPPCRLRRIRLFYISTRNYFALVKGLSAFSYGRRCYLFVAFLALYLGLDFADPSMPGALNFDVALNHDIVLAKVVSKIDEASEHLPALPARIAPAMREIDRRGISQRFSRYVIADWLVDLRIAQSRPRHAALSLEDH